MNPSMFEKTEELMMTLLKLHVTLAKNWIFWQEAKQITEAYFLTKPLTLVEAYSWSETKVTTFVNAMEKFFFVKVSRLGAGSVHIFLSRFKSLIDILNNGVSDSTADLNGVLYGYDTRSVFEYCARVKPDLIK